MGSCSVHVKCFQLGPWLPPGQNRALVNLRSMPSGGAGMARQCANYFSLSHTAAAVPVSHWQVLIAIASRKLASRGL